MTNTAYLINQMASEVIHQLFPGILVLMLIAGVILWIDDEYDFLPWEW